jgi:ABC-type nitrate/sulfonate/bicarbonate transport system permease component
MVVSDATESSAAGASTLAAPDAAEGQAGAGRWLTNKWVLRLISLVVVMGGWELVGSNINPIFLSTPTKIGVALIEMLRNGDLVRALGISIAGISIGFSAALVVGIPVGIMMGRNRSFEYLLDPWVNALFVTPRVALIPLILIWFGIGFEAQVVVIFLSSVFPILINSYAGVRNISGSLVDVGRVFGASERQLFAEIILPASVPFIMTGLRLGIGHAVIAMVVAQMFLAQVGLGRLLVQNGDRFRTDNVFAVIIAIGLLGVALTEVVKQIERRYAHWKESERAFY